MAVHNDQNPMTCEVQPHTPALRGPGLAAGDDAYAAAARVRCGEAAVHKQAAVLDPVRAHDAGGAAPERIDQDGLAGGRRGGVAGQVAHRKGTLQSLYSGPWRFHNSADNDMIGNSEIKIDQETS